MKTNTKPTKHTLTLLAALLLAPLALQAAEPAPIVLRDLPLLFADDSGIAAKNGVKRTVHPAKTRQPPFPRPPVRPNGSFRSLSQKANS
jgi:hypothetical protein